MKKNIRNMFVIVNVDQNKASLPPFVDRVPMIVTAKKELVYDENIAVFLGTLYQKSVDRDIVPFSTLTSRNAFSDTFSFVHDNVMTSDCGVPTGYVFLGDDKTQQIQTPKEDTRSSDRFDSKMMESLIAQRNMDVQRVMQMNPRPV